MQVDKRLIILNVIPSRSHERVRQDGGEEKGKQLHVKSRREVWGSVMCGAEPVEQILGNDSNNIILHQFKSRFYGR